MYYPCSENKGADQLRSYCEADLRLCFRIGNNPVFSRCGSNQINYFSQLIALWSISKLQMYRYIYMQTFKALPHFFFSLEQLPSLVPNNSASGWAGAFSRDFTINLILQCRAFIGALQIRKVKSPCIPSPYRGRGYKWCTFFSFTPLSRLFHSQS